MFENLRLLNDKHFNSLLEIIINEELNNEPDEFNSIKSFCNTAPLYEFKSNLIQIKFDELHTIHSKIIPKNILWTTIVDSAINQIDFKYSYYQIIKNIENINFEKFVFYDVKRENYRLLFHYFKDKLSDDFVSMIIVIRGIPEDLKDIMNFNISNGK
jgi:hypothetical protein